MAQYRLSLLGRSAQAQVAAKSCVAVSKTAPVPPKLERVRQSSIGADVPSTLSPELSDMQAKFRAMPRGQNDEFFTFGWKTAVHFKGDKSKITQALFDAAGSDRKLQAKIKPVMTSLMKYRLI